MIYMLDIHIRQQHFALEKLIIFMPTHLRASLATLMACITDVSRCFTRLYNMLGKKKIYSRTVSSEEGNL